jgi:hypothetical protein
MFSKALQPMETVKQIHPIAERKLSIIVLETNRWHNDQQIVIIFLYGFIRTNT